MRCRYCGSDSLQFDGRCGRCQHRSEDETGRRFPVADSAAALNYDFDPDTPAEPPQGLATVVNNPGVPRRARPPIQTRLFSSEDGRKVIGFGEYAAAAVRAHSTRSARSSARKVADNQSAFDFTLATKPAHPAPLSREISRRSDLPVAAFRFRAMAAAFDAGFVIALAGLFLLIIRLCLQSLPRGPLFDAAYATAILVIAVGYKLLFCFFSRATLGQQGARLRIVSFDGHSPSRQQRIVRMWSGWLSIASAGIGIVWALFDPELLSWHDHMSQTFLTYDD